jgi:hypothetical protein
LRRDIKSRGVGVVSWFWLNASVSIAGFAEVREEKILYSSTIPESFQEEGAPVIRYQGAFSYVGIER